MLCFGANIHNTERRNMMPIDDYFRKSPNNYKRERFIRAFEQSMRFNNNFINFADILSTDWIKECKSCRFNEVPSLPNLSTRNGIIRLLCSRFITKRVNSILVTYLKEKFGIPFLKKLEQEEDHFNVYRDRASNMDRIGLIEELIPSFDSLAHKELYDSLSRIMRQYVFNLIRFYADGYNGFIKLLKHDLTILIPDCKEVRIYRSPDCQIDPQYDNEYTGLVLNILYPESIRYDSNLNNSVYDKELKDEDITHYRLMSERYSSIKRKYIYLTPNDIYERAISFIHKSIHYIDSMGKDVPDKVRYLLGSRWDKMIRHQLLLPFTRNSIFEIKYKNDRKSSVFYIDRASNECYSDSDYDLRFMSRKWDMNLTNGISYLVKEIEKSDINISFMVDREMYTDNIEKVSSSLCKNLATIDYNHAMKERYSEIFRDYFGWMYDPSLAFYDSADSSIRYMMYQYSKIFDSFVEKVIVLATEMAHLLRCGFDTKEVIEGFKKDVYDVLAPLILSDKYVKKIVNYLEKKYKDKGLKMDFSVGYYCPSPERYLDSGRNISNQNIIYEDNQYCSTNYEDYVSFDKDIYVKTAIESLAPIIHKLMVYNDDYVPDERGTISLFLECTYTPTQTSTRKLSFVGVSRIPFFIKFKAISSIYPEYNIKYDLSDRDALLIQTTLKRACNRILRNRYKSYAKYFILFKRFIALMMNNIYEKYVPENRSEDMAYHMLEMVTRYMDNYSSYIMDHFGHIHYKSNFGYFIKELKKGLRAKICKKAFSRIEELDHVSMLIDPNDEPKDWQNIEVDIKA